MARGTYRPLSLEAVESCPGSLENGEQINTKGSFCILCIAERAERRQNKGGVKIVIDCGPVRELIAVPCEPVVRVHAGRARLLGTEFAVHRVSARPLPT